MGPPLAGKHEGGPSSVFHVRPPRPSSSLTGGTRRFVFSSFSFSLHLLTASSHIRMLSYSLLHRVSLRPPSPRVAPIASPSPCRPHHESRLLRRAALSHRPSSRVAFIASPFVTSSSPCRRVASPLPRCPVASPSLRRFRPCLVARAARLLNCPRICGTNGGDSVRGWVGWKCGCRQ